MSSLIKQTVTVRAGGVVEVSSPDLHEGEEAEVIIVVTRPADSERNAAKIGGWRRFAGAIASGDPHSADNDRIDADLAAEYGNEPRAES